MQVPTASPACAHRSACPSALHAPPLQRHAAWVCVGVLQLRRLPRGPGPPLLLCRRAVHPRPGARHRHQGASKGRCRGGGTAQRGGAILACWGPWCVVPAPLPAAWLLSAVQSQSHTCTEQPPRTYQPLRTYSRPGPCCCRHRRWCCKAGLPSPTTCSPLTLASLRQPQPCRGRRSTPPGSSRLTGVKSLVRTNERSIVGCCLGRRWTLRRGAAHAGRVAAAALACRACAKPRSTESTALLWRAVPSFTAPVQICGAI